METSKFELGKLYEFSHASAHSISLVRRTAPSPRFPKGKWYSVKESCISSGDKFVVISFGEKLVFVATKNACGFMVPAMRKLCKEVTIED